MDRDWPEDDNLPIIGDKFTVPQTVVAHGGINGNEEQQQKMTIFPKHSASDYGSFMVSTSSSDVFGGADDGGMSTRANSIVGGQSQMQQR